MIELRHVFETCLINKKNRQCRYLSKVEGSAEYICSKTTGDKILIDSVIKDFKSYNSHLPIADNCDGKS